MEASPAVFWAVKVSARRAALDLGTYCVPAGNMFPRAAKTEPFAVATLLARLDCHTIQDGIISKSFNEK
jgi:hypothetical protein